MAFFYLLFLLLGSQPGARPGAAGFPGGPGERILRSATEDQRRHGAVHEGQDGGQPRHGGDRGRADVPVRPDHWLLWGFLFFALNYVTYIGSIAACVPPIALAYLDLEQPRVRRSWRS